MGNDRSRRQSEAALVDIYLVRHGQAGEDRSWHYEQAQIKQLGFPLSDLGLHQAEALAAYLSSVHFDHIYCSDLLRAYETAREIHNYHADTSINVSTELREVHAGHVEEIDRLPSEQLAKERQRVQAMVDLLRSYTNGESILLVAHGNIFRLLLAILSDTDPLHGMRVDMCNASVSRAIIDESGRLRIRESNNVSFLQEEQITYL